MPMITRANATDGTNSMEEKTFLLTTLPRPTLLLQRALEVAGYNLLAIKLSKATPIIMSLTTQEKALAKHYKTRSSRPRSSTLHMQPEAPLTTHTIVPGDRAGSVSSVGGPHALSTPTLGVPGASAITHIGTVSSDVLGDNNTRANESNKSDIDSPSISFVRF